ncbi:hypothetical protein [Algoriphagus aquimarinus]|uniref:Uncharacterized protein n=1 Tax=Algoriphagus aquimarinus TaxID=237018 RepID=A0A5C7AIP9_9BACT|nr:hypothetical protein [Algoriphagus aquimarinus]TXE06455.1 hypothetical protein ESV85_16910 [Algoriphagus aquimarinus]
MKNIKNLSKHLMTMFALSIFLLTACEIEPKESITPPGAEGISSNMMDRFKSLPEGFQARIDPKLNFGSESARQTNLGVQTDQQYREIVRRILNAVEDSECSDTDLYLWLDEELADWDDEVIFYAIVSGMLDFPTYDAFLFENSSEGQYFGKDGEYTQSTTKAFKDLQRFWNIDSKGIVLAAMHGNMLLDREKVIRIDKILYGDDQETAEDYADLILDLLDYFPQYRNGDHPIFTFNAFATSGFFFPPAGGDIPPKIIMGDGILEAYSALGFDDVAPQAILAHEFGHHIQFQLGLFDSPITDPAEATRRTEMMADAYSAYYLSHARGATMQWKRVQQFLEVFFNIGDCGFDNSGHHGTPLQRMAAAEWGYQVANTAKKQGQILTSEEFAALFEAKLPELVAVP